MIKKQYKNVNPCKLQDELISAGLVAGSFITFDLGNDTAEIQLPDDVDLELVESVVAKHDKTPLPPPKSELEIMQSTIDSLGTQLVQAKISNMQKDSLIKNLGTQITQGKLEDLQNKTINNYLGSQLVQAKLNLIKVQGGI